MRILYLADIRLPLERANGIQTMETCHALARRGHQVRLLVRPDTQTPARDPLAFYDLPPLPPHTPHAPESRHAQPPPAAGSAPEGTRSQSARPTLPSGGGRLTIARVAVRGPAPFRRVHYLTGAIAQALRGGRVDVILTRDLGVASLLLRWPRTRRPPVVYESHGYAPVVTGLLPELLSGAPRASRTKARRLAARERRVWEHADGYVTITATLAQELERRLGPRAAVAIIPDGARVAADRRFDWSGPATPPVVTYAGHLYPWKGVETLLGALAAAPALRGRIVGGHPGEPDLARLQRFAATLGLGDRVEFVGMRPPGEIPGHLRASDLLVLPNRATSVSASYTSPLKLFEYLAAGRPIVASDLPALREILRDRENAWLVPADDPHALAEALETLARDRPLALRLARAAFDAAADFSWDRRAERLEDVLYRSAAVGAGGWGLGAGTGKPSAID